MTANSDTPRSGENVSDAQAVEQTVLREVVESHLDSVADQLLRAIRESEDVEELGERVDEASAELALVEKMLAEEEDE
jgi:hypothetical protein